MLKTDGYSAKVRLTLIVSDLRLSLCQVCPSVVFLHKSCTPIPPTEAIIVISVDGKEKTRRVFLPHGISGERVSYY
jgi:hypothetical protein